MTAKTDLAPGADFTLLHHFMDARFIASAVKTERPRTESVIARGHDAENYRYTIERQLQKGEIPRFLIEEGHLIGEGEDESSDRIIAYLRAILEKLARATTGQPLPEIKIFLADQPGVVAGVITNTPTPLLIFGLGLFDFLHEHGFGEDHIAGVLGHERFHLRRHDKWKHLDNGRPEEAVGDVYGALESYKAGYNPRALGDVFRKLDEIAQAKNKKQRDEKRKSSSVLASLLDVHPPVETRIRNIDVALAGLQLTKKLSETMIAIPETIASLAAATHYRNACERFMAEHGYAHAAPAEKVDLLGHFIANTLKEEDKNLMKLRLLATIPYFKALRGEPYTHIAGGAWFDHFMRATQKDFDWHHDARTSYRWVMEQFLRLKIMDRRRLTPAEEKAFVFERDEKKFLIPDGSIPSIFATAQKYSERFIEAQTRAEAIQAAQRLQKARNVLAKYGSGIDAFDLDEFKMTWPLRAELRKAIKAGVPTQLPWEKHVRWALGADAAEENAAANTELIKEIAVSVGVNDPRLGPLAGWQEYRLKAALKGEFSDLTLDDQGRVTAIKPNQEDLDEIYKERFIAATYAELLEREHALQTARDMAEEKKVASIKWSSMERDFWGFVKRHADRLTPAITIVDGQHPFAREFAKQLDALVRKNPATWRAVHRSFYMGTWPKHKERAYGDDKYYPNSLPYLVERFEKRYFGYASQHRHNNHFERGRLPPGHPESKRLSAAPEYFSSNEKPKTESGFTEINGNDVWWTRKRRARLKHKQTVEIDYGVDPAHPFVEQILRIPNSSDYADDKIKLFINYRANNPGARTLEGYYAIHPRDILNYKQPLTRKSFDRLSEIIPERMNGSDYVQHAIPIELLLFLRRLDQAPAPQRFSFAGLDPFLVNCHFYFLNDIRLASACADELTALVEAQVERNRRIDFQPNRKLPSLIETFRSEHGSSRGWANKTYSVFVTRPQLERDYEDHIQKRIMALPIGQRVEPLAELMRLEFKRPEYRTWVVDSWVEAAAAKLGIDNGSPAFAKRAEKIIGNVLRKMHSSQGISCIVKLLDRVEAQAEVALAAKRELVDYYGQRFLEKDGAARAVDALVETCSNDEELRPAFLKFITEPMSDSGNETFLKLIKRNAPYSEFVKQLVDQDRKFALSHEEQITMTGYAHQNFWVMPFELRTIYIDRILFPMRQTDGQSFKDSVAYVFDKTLPLDRKFASEAREALTIYLDCCPPELRRITFSALLSAAIQTDDAAPLRPGQVLSYVLTRTGAAGGQLLQAAHSYLSGLDLADADLIQFRDDLKSSKVDFDRPYRWDIFERMAEILSAAKIAGIKHVGAILGCGSTAYVVATDATALKIMRKDVRPIADLQFERYREAFTQLAAKHAHYKPLPALVDRAVETIQVSTNGFFAAEQVRYAEGKYNPLSATINGEVFQPKVAALQSCGPEYLETDRVHGEHLNEMKADTPEEAQRRRFTAIAIDAIEEFLTLTGAAVDEDCHSGQQKTRDHMIGRFDLGAVPFDAAKKCVAMPTEAQKYAAGKLYGLILNAALNGGSPVQAMTDAIATRDWGAEKAYLVGLQRARLARMDLYAAFGSSTAERQKVQAIIIKAVWDTGRVDPAILNGMMETFAPQSAFTLAKLAVTSCAASAKQSVADLFTGSAKRVTQPLTICIHDASQPAAKRVALLPLAGSFAWRKLKLGSSSCS